jgi:N-acetylmuramoyl-L-alanine amidase
LASGRSFADALSVVPVASKLGMPILLTDTNEYNSSNKNFVETNNISVTYIVCGDSVISNSNMKNYKNPVRVGGADRYETNIEILNTFKGSINTDKMNFPYGLVVHL